MSVVKDPDGRYSVYVYSPAKRRNVYVGRRRLEREAKALFREKTDEFAKQSPARKLTCRAYAREWLAEHHGQGTNRPASSTHAHNEGMLRPFLEDFGDRLIDGGIGRKEALRWARRHPHNAKAASAMFNDAINDEETLGNPFANRRHEQPRGRQDIYPMTEEEVERLAGIAEQTWGSGGYGLVARALVLFGAWVGARPGETLTRTDADLDVEGGLVRVTRVKGAKQTEWIVLPRQVIAALDAMPPRHSPRLFSTVQGKPMGTKGDLHYYWSPIRAAFKTTCTPERWAELLEGQSDRRSLDFYALRHFCASIIVDRGGDEYDVAQQLGNTPEVCRKVYIHGYRDRVNERNRARLEGAPNVVDLGERRRQDRRGA